MRDRLEVFAFLARCLKAGRRCALVTVINVTGASVRNPGAHMGVADNGRFAGSLSGGCIEAAIVGEALKALEAGMARTVRFGQGSPIIDIRLPCGGSVDLLITPADAALDPAGLIERFSARLPVDLALPAPDGHVVRIAHAPPLRVLILGHGASVDALAVLAESVGCAVAIMTPDPALAARRPGIATMLASSATPPTLPSDPWTACACLFHDHDWEAPLLAAALAGDLLYVGAMGSHATHARRVASLRAMGVGHAAIARIRAPIGIIPSSRDPETLALSVLTEIVAAYNAARPTRLLDAA